MITPCTAPFKTLTLLTGVLFLGACASPGPIISMPAKPADQVDVISASLTLANDFDLSDNVVQMPYHLIKAGSSVVINVPADAFTEKGDPELEDQDDFKTKDFFNEAEQEIERELIRHGFRVLSRAKLEAKLRNLRDEGACTDRWWRCSSSSVDPEVATILDQLTEQFESGDIEATEYADQVKKFKAQMQVSSVGRSRGEGEKELTDISEVIRAAQEGDIQSEYILQINSFDTLKIVRKSINLLSNSQVRDFTAANPEIKKEMEEKQYLPCGFLAAELNAKLINVKSGEIIWIGKHQLNELNSGEIDYSVELGSRRYVTNYRQVENYVQYQNSADQRNSRGNNPVALPAWEYASDLVGPNLTSGNCRYDQRSRDEIRDMRSNLSRQAARELIRTIKVSSP
ncbi:MAG: hypothetical protein V7711_05025 [Pseudomonadales bacterium]